MIASTPSSPPPAHGDPLTWLEGCSEYPKMLLWDRGRDEFIAGSGAAASLVPSEPTAASELERSLSARLAEDAQDSPGWIGGMRFAPQRPASESWSSFGSGWWFRPARWRSRRGGRDSSGESPVRSDWRAKPVRCAPGEAPDSYLERVRCALQELNGPDLAKVVLARSVHRAGRIDPVATLARLASEEPSGTLYWLAPCADHGFLGVTPETLYRREGVRLETEALAATAPLSDRAGQALLRDDKSLREHAYVRDAIARALQPMASSLRFDSVPTVLSLARLHHLRTPILATLRDPLPQLARLHPTPAVCGTPFARAESAIARLESVDRGLYSGAVGWWRPSGESVYVALRGAHYANEGSTAFLGAGIVQGSVPEQELAELDLKAASLFEAFSDAGDGRAE